MKVKRERTEEVVALAREVTALAHRIAVADVACTDAWLQWDRRRTERSNLQRDLARLNERLATLTGAP